MHMICIDLKSETALPVWPVKVNLNLTQVALDKLHQLNASTVNCSLSTRGQACLERLRLSQWTSLFSRRVNKLGRPCWLNILLKIQRCDHNWGMCTSRHRPSPCEAQQDSLSLGSNLSVSPLPCSNQSGARGLMESRHNGLSWPFFSSQLCHYALSVVGVYKA